jgi:hypothetical protein
MPTALNTETYDAKLIAMRPTPTIFKNGIGATPPSHIALYERCHTGILSLVLTPQK